MRANAQALADFLKGKGYKMATDGTENHLMLWDLRPLGLTGSKMEKVRRPQHSAANTAPLLQLHTAARRGEATHPK